MRRVGPSLLRWVRREGVEAFGRRLEGEGWLGFSLAPTSFRQPPTCRRFGTLAAREVSKSAPVIGNTAFQTFALSRRTWSPVQVSAVGTVLSSRCIQSSADDGSVGGEPVANLDLITTGDVGAVVTSSIKDIELALIADSGWWSPVQACFSYFHTLHWTFDLPWVGAVALGTVFVRILLSPVNVEQMRMAERMAIAKPEIDALTAQAKEAAARGGQDAQHYSLEMQRLWKKHGVHPGRALGANLVVLPTMLLLPISILNLPKLGLPSVSAESFFWIQDISQADPMYVLPVASSALFFGAIQFNMSPESMTPQMKKLLPIFKILPVAFLPITVQLPALFHFFGLTSIIFQTGQTLALKNKGIRNYLGFRPLGQAIAQAPPPPPLSEIKEAEVVRAPPKQASNAKKGSGKKKRRRSQKKKR